MLLGFDKLINLVETQKLVERLSEEELSKNGGVAFDLRLGEVHEFVGEGFLGINDRKTPETKLLGKFVEGDSKKIKIESNKYYLVKTFEKINCPDDLAFFPISRSTLFRSGLLLITGLGDPGFKGECTFGLINIHSKPFTIELGSRIANVVFYRLDGKASNYEGAYQGGNLGSEIKK